MTIEQRTVGDVVVLSINGDIAMNGAGATLLADRVGNVLHAGHSRLLLDLAHVRYVDSAGLGELVHAFAAVRTRGGAIKLLNVSRRLNDRLAVTRLLAVFDCFDHEREALASFDRQPLFHHHVPARHGGSANVILTQGPVRQ
jgi:anti-anti-sigma factor